MHNNYYFLKQVSSRLQEQLAGFTLVSCFSQAKDEIVFEFNNAKRSFFIRADLQGDFTCLTFPTGFKRARKNSVDLFDDAIMKKVIGLNQFENERSFAILLEDDLGIVFKMHGNRSNVLLTKNNETLQPFKKNKAGDIDKDRIIDWSREAFEKNIDHLEKLYFTFGKPVWIYLKKKGFNESNADKKWELIQETLSILNNPDKYFIIDHGISMYLSLVPFGSIVDEYDDPFTAVNQYATNRAGRLSFNRRVEQKFALANKEAKATKKYLETTRERLAGIEHDDHYKTWGDLLMANLHRIESNKDSVQLEDFYNNNQPIDIPLDKSLSPQKNAERYYRKNKNQAIEISKLKESIDKYEKKLQEAEMAVLILGDTRDDEQFQLLIEQVEAENKQAEKESIPFWQFEFKGFTIFVGKDAKNNDELTTKWAHKNDLWLHARDVPGSHVVVRHKAGQPFPKDVIEYAAGIAAFNSKRKGETLAPVIFTPKKFVRKKKGAAAGSVIVDREEVILVEPKNPTA
ncbi:MAG: NFACT RNA binding domain-containing protein [Bacteroidota bacterium]